MFEKRNSISLFSLLLFCLCLGCGTGEYESRLQLGIEKAKKESKFNELRASEEVTGTKVSIRAPKFFGTAWTEGAVVDGKAVDPVRLKPLSLPGLKNTYELTIQDDKQGSLAYYCYVGVCNDAINIFDSEINNQYITNSGYSRTSDWTSFNAPTPEGKTMAWRKVRLTGAMKFFYKTQIGQENMLTMNGVMDIFTYQEPGTPLVVIAWRFPADIESKIELDKWESLVAGGVSVKP
jgi:hypothetical protein